MLATKNGTKRGRLIYFAPPYMITAAPLLAEFVAEFLVNFFFVFKTRAATKEKKATDSTSAPRRETVNNKNAATPRGKKIEIF